MKIKKLKITRKIVLFLLLAILVIGGSFYFFSQKASASWYNENWLYRQAITLTVTSSSSDITDLDTALTVSTSSLITASKIQSSCQDLRFTSQSGKVLPYYIASGCNTTATKIWVRADLVPKNTTTYTLYMYYGNSTATAGSDSAKFALYNGLIDYWNMNEASANTCTGGVNDSCDLSFSGNDGAWNGNTANTTGKFGNGTSFDGTGDYINGFASSISPVGSRTICAWIKPADTTRRGLFGTRPALASTGFSFVVNRTTAGNLTYFHIGGTPVFEAAAGITANVWQQACVTLNTSTSTATFYVNGSSVASQGSFTAESASAFNGMIGGEQDTDPGTFNGTMDDVRIYNRVLSSSEISQLYNDTTSSILTSVKGQIIPTTSFATEEQSPGPTAYWKFDDGQGTTVQDATAQNNDGTVSGATWQPENLCVSGKCLYFDGSTSKVTVANTVNNVKSVSFWVKPKTNGETLMDFDGGSHYLSASSGTISATGFANDGACTVSTNTNINTASCAGRSTADAVNFSVTANTASGQNQVTVSATPTGLAVGDEVLIINLRGTSSDYSNVGQYETHYITTISTNTLTLDSALTNTYDGTTQKIMVQRVPNYTTVTVDATKTMSATAWDGSKGGVLFFQATGTVTNSGIISVAGLGYAAGSTYTGGTGGYQGEGYKGVGINTNSTARKSANAEGGGSPWDSASNTGYAEGGGGGGYGDVGSNGTYSHTNNQGQGSGGSTYGSASLPTLFFGSAGGAGASGYNGTWNQGNGTTDGKGGNGGGIIFISAATVSNTGTISANGNTGSNGWGYTTSCGQSICGGGGGSGAGGSVLIKGTTLTLGSGLVTSSGGSTTNGAGGSYGNGWNASTGGAGGAGRIALYSDSISGTTSPTLNAYTYAAPAVTMTSTVTMYVNGKVSSTLTANTWQHIEITTTASFNASSIKIGNVSSSYLNGFVDDVKIYPYARTGAQVKTDYDAGKANATAHSGTSAALGSKPQDWLSNGLVGYWKMDEASGTLADSSGNSNTGTWYGTGASHYTAGKFGNGGGLNGTDDYVDAGTSSTLNITGNITVSAWVKYDDVTTGTSRNIVSRWDTASNQRQYTLVNDTTTSKMGFLVSNDGTITTRGSNYQYAEYAITVDSLWHHVVGTYDQTNVRIYEDGVLKDIQAFNKTIYSVSSQSLLLGALKISGSPARFYDGNIDETRIYNRALSPKEISDLYNWAPGPVADWEFEVGIGTTSYDTSGNGNNGAWAGTGTKHWDTGKYGKAGKFNGTDDYVNAGNASSLKLTGNMTTEAWIKPASTATGMIMAKDSSTAGDRGWYFTQVAGGTIRLLVSSNGTTTAYFDTTATLTTNAWTHVTATYDGTNINIYFNGVKQAGTLTGSVPSTQFNTSTNVNIGRRPANDNFFNGLIDGAQIYNYARTVNQIVSDMNAGHPAVGSPVGSPVGYWKFDEGQGTTANNSGSGGLTQKGTLAASPTWTNSGKFGKALTFNGSNNNVSMGNVLNFGASDSLTLSAWFKSAGTNTDSRILAKQGSVGAGNPGYQISIASDVIYGNIVAGTGTQQVTVTGPNINDSTWHHIVVTRDYGKTIKMYIDGVQKDSQVDTVTNTLTNSRPLSIGAEDDGASTISQGFNGTIDEVKIYNYALTADEVKLDYNHGSSLVLGAAGDNSTYQKGAANQEYCVPGDATSCVAPVAEWKFEVGMGTTAFDTSGNGSSGAWNGTLGNQWGIGKVGKGGNFNGTDNFLDMGDPASGILDFGTSDFTIETWVKIPAGVSGAILQKATILGSSSAAGISLYTRASDPYVRITISDGSNPVLATGAGFTTDIRDNKWHHLGITFNSTTDAASFYLDGKFVYTSTSGSAIGSISNSSNFFLGKIISSGPSTTYHTGSIDQVSLFNYARSAAQVAYDYNRGKPVGWWKFDECQGTIANDSSGNGYSGTISIGGTGTQTVIGTCVTPTDGTGAWYNGISGKRNSSLSFDGTDDKITVATAITGVQSVAFWTKPATSTDSYMDFDGGTHYITSSSGTVSATGFSSPTIYVNGVSGGTITGGAWNHVVITTGTAFNTTSSFTLGYKAAATADYLNGQIDDVRVFNYALTAAQVKDIMNNGAINFAPVSGSP